MVLRMDDLSVVDRQVLRERHLVSRELIGGEGVAEIRPASAVVVSESASVMVNEEDHLRLQVFRSGCDIAGALQVATRVTESLASRCRSPSIATLDFSRRARPIRAPGCAHQ